MSQQVGGKSGGKSGGKAGAIDAGRSRSAKAGKFLFDYLGG